MNQKTKSHDAPKRGVVSRPDRGGQRPDEPNPAADLSQVLAENVAADRRAYASAWYRAELIGSVLGQDERFRRLGEMLSLKVVMDRPRYHSDFDSSAQHLMSLSTAGSTDRIFVVAPPYDEVYTEFLPTDARGTAARGPSAIKDTGRLDIDLTETYVDRPVAEGGWMWAGAGVGIWFKPKAVSTFVRVSGLVHYDYWWRDDSNLQVAHNRAQLCKMVYRWLGPGNTQRILDRRDWLWQDGTSWYETHEDSGDSYWSNQDFFWASSDDWYLVWFWCNGGIDFATKTTIGSSTARQIWTVRVPFVVFEEWA